MALKDKACKECGHLTQEDKCEICNSKNFVEKYKGTMIIFQNDTSIIAEKAKTTANGKFALKY